MLPPLIVLTAFVIAPQMADRSAYLFRATDKPGTRYHPRSGDIVLFDDHSPLTARIYNMFGTAGPLHAGIVFQKPDGKMAILEAGTNAVMKVFVFDLDTRLHGFDGTILVRQLRKPLNDEQTTRLADFALAQEGKPYSIGRVVLHMMPLRPRTSYLTPIFGRTVLDRERWICSELVVASAVTAGVLNGDDYPANAMVPRDLAYDERFDLGNYYERPALWYPRPHLEQVGGGVRVGALEK
jgi:hypothetical protein